MGKASSAKKVARAARAGGSSHRERPKIAFPLSIFVILVLGASLVFVSRTAHEDTAGADQAPSFEKKDHFHAAYGFYVCDHFLPAAPDPQVDALGIHTHGDGVIHIHPFTAAASGTRAKLKVFGDNISVKFTDDGWTGSDGVTHKTGDDCNGKPGKVAVYRFRPDEPNRPIDVYDNDFNNIVFNEDRNAYTIALLPEGAEPPPAPDSVAELDKLTDVAGANPQTSTPSISIPSDPTATVPLDPSATTLPVDPSATTLPTDPSATPTTAPTVSTPGSTP